MTDFDYGDFTQQGIDNKVTLKARLNERRYVSLDLQSDVEGPNLTISGNVHDELNNIDYPIGSAPSGNIAITENTAEGSPLNIAQYATATVNVSGGGMDFVIPEQTINSSATEGVAIQTNFSEILTDKIVLQVITTAYGQPFHVFNVLTKQPLPDNVGVEYTVTMTGRIGGSTMTLQIHITKLDTDEDWKISFIINDTQTAFTNVLISAIAEWDTTPQ